MGIEVLDDFVELESSVAVREAAHARRQEHDWQGGEKILRATEQA